MNQQINESMLLLTIIRFILFNFLC